MGDPIQVLAAVDGRPVVTRRGRLCLGEEATSITHVIGCAVSEDDKLVAAVSLQKEVFVLSRNGSSWKTMVKHFLPKRLTAVAFDSTSNLIIVSDAFGDVYSLPLTVSINARDEESRERHLLLGHFSTVTDMAPAKGLLATADRDNKIRISRLPSAYVIESFCLGHQEFVTTVCWTRVADRLISGDGEGYLRLWAAQKGEELSSVNLCEDKVVRSVMRASDSAVVTKVLLYPSNDDKAIFSLHGCSSVFVLSGIREGLLHHVRREFCLPDDASISGLVLCDAGEVLISAIGDDVIRRLSVQREDTSQSAFIEVGQYSVPGEVHGNEGDVPKVQRDDADVLRVEWLAKQRKKEMVENWKGKKRRHIEI